MKLIIEVNGKEEIFTMEEARKLYSKLGEVFNSGSINIPTPRPTTYTPPTTNRDINDYGAPIVESRGTITTGAQGEVTGIKPGLNQKVEAAKTEARARTSGCGSR